MISTGLDKFSVGMVRWTSSTRTRLRPVSDLDTLEVNSYYFATNGWDARGDVAN